MSDGRDPPHDAHKTCTLALTRKPEQLVNLAHAQRAAVPLIKRFTGGGTVTVDSDTVFATLIFQASCRGSPALNTHPLHAWANLSCCGTHINHQNTSANHNSMPGPEDCSDLQLRPSVCCAG
jgi:hypothetical protein